MNLIFDSHAHYDDKQFDLDRHELLKSMPKKGVYGIINCAVDIKSSLSSIELAKKYPFVWAACGIYPHNTQNINNTDLTNLKNILKTEKVVAIGEIGLDYHYDFADKKHQKYAFEKQLEISKEFKLPVIIHDREAHQDTLSLLKKYKPKGVIHCFSGSLEMANEVVNLGMYIGIGGAVTFKNTKKIIEVSKNIPINKILLETDCPYMAPVPYRSKRCDSSLIYYTATKIAEIKNDTLNNILYKTKQNALDLFIKEV